MDLTFGGGLFDFFTFENLCTEKQALGVCIREWADPLTAILTIIAIAFAIAQVRHAARQSDAAVRENLSSFRTALEAELAEVRSAVGELGDPAWWNVSFQELAQEAKVEVNRVLMNSPERRKIAEMDLYYNRVRMAFVVGATFGANLKQLHEYAESRFQVSDDFFADIPLSWEGYQHLVARCLLSGRAYEKQLVDEIDIVTFALSDIDLAVLRSVRNNLPWRRLGRQIRYRSFQSRHGMNMSVFGEAMYRLRKKFTRK